VGDGSQLTPEQLEEMGFLQADITDVTIASPPTLTFTLTTESGVPATGAAEGLFGFTLNKLVPAADGAPSKWVSYINSVETASGDSTPNILDQAVHAGNENGSAGTFEEIGDGVYQYTFAIDPADVTTPIAVEYEPELVHRVGLELRGSGDFEALAPANPVYDFIPATGEGVPLAKNIAATESCNACHDRLQLHGGPRITVEYCVTCHNPGTIDQDSGDSVDMAYMTHSIHAARDYSIWGFRDSLHNYADVTYPQDLLWCENCHVASEDTPDGGDFAVTATATSCGGCHGDGLIASNPDPVTGVPTYSYQHAEFGSPIPDTTCVQCHAEGGVAGSTLANHTGVAGSARLRTAQGEDFTYEILSVTPSGPGETPTATFQILDADGAPIDILTADSFDVSEGQRQRLRLQIAWTPDAVYNGFEDGTLQVPHAESLEYDLFDFLGDLVANADGSFSFTFPEALPANLPGELMVVLEGRRILADGTRAYPDSEIFFPGEARDTIASQAACENCHDQLAFHGGSRAGDPTMCVVCHNSDAAFAVEGIGTIALGPMSHQIHAGLYPGFEEVTYPQPLANCLACHEEGTFYAARSTARPVSIDEGADTLRWDDDIAISATSAACASCHVGPNYGASAQAHMEQNGGVFNGVKGEMAIPSSSTETCLICHGEGRIADTAASHGQL